MSYCEKINCGYYWQEEGERYPHCHFDGPEGWAPCEEQEESIVDDSYDPGLEPDWKLWEDDKE